MEKILERELYYSNPWNESDYIGPWVAFDTDKEFSNIYSSKKNCKECLKRLDRQLNVHVLMNILFRREPKNIRLKEALNCWKVVAFFDGIELYGIQRILIDHGNDLLPGKELYGKFGGEEMPGTQKIVLYTGSEEEVDEKRFLMEKWILGIDDEDVYCGGVIHVKGGCDLHEPILGDPNEWKRKTPIKYPNKIPEVMKRIDSFMRHY